MALGADLNTGFIRLEAGVIGTIATGVLIVTQSAMIVAAESGTADNLDTLTIDTSLTMPSGYCELLILKADTGDTITITDNVGNIQTNTGSSFSLTGDKLAMLFRMAGANNWTLFND